MSRLIPTSAPHAHDGRSHGVRPVFFSKFLDSRMPSQKNRGMSNTQAYMVFHIGRSHVGLEPP